MVSRCDLQIEVPYGAAMHVSSSLAHSIVTTSSLRLQGLYPTKGGISPLLVRQPGNT